MAQVYKIENKRYEFKEIDSAVVNSYLLQEEDHNKWIKLKTDEDSIDLQLPDNLSEGFRCVIENTGVFTVNYLNAAGTSAATQQDKFTEDQFRTVEVVFNDNVWRLQGYIGRQDLSSLYDVNVIESGLPSDGDVLTYNINNNQWEAGVNPPYTPADPFFLDHIITNDDHGQTLLFDTTALPLTAILNLGLNEGFYCTVVNIGTGSLEVSTSGTLNAITTSLNQYQAMNILHAAGDIFYGVINSGDSSGGGGAGYAAGNYTNSFIATSYTGNIAFTHETNSNSLAIGTQATSFEDDQIVIGSLSTADGISDIAIGPQSDCNGSGTAKIAIGSSSSSDAEAGIAIGEFSTAGGLYSIAIGRNAIATSQSSMQLGTGANTDTSTLNFLNTKIAHAYGINVRKEEAHNTVTSTHRFAEDVNNGGVPQEATFLSLAMSFPNKQLYVGTGTAFNSLEPWKQWAPIGARPDLDNIIGNYSDNLARTAIGAHYYQPGLEQPLWSSEPLGSTDNLNNEQWVSVEWLDSSQLGANIGTITYRRHYQNEPYFRFTTIGGDDIKYARWAVQTNVNGLDTVDNGSYSVPAADLTSISSLLEQGDRVLFTGQTDSTTNGIYRYDTFDGSFYIFNRPLDLVLGNAFGSEEVRVWGDFPDRGTYTPSSSVNVGDALTFTYALTPVITQEGALYFNVKAPGHYLVNVRLLLRNFTTPTNPDARGILTLRKINTVANVDVIMDQFRYNLFTKNSSGVGILNDIRLSETIKLDRDIYYFTLQLIDVPETYLYSDGLIDNFPSSRIDISPIQLFEVTR